MITYLRPTTKKAIDMRRAYMESKCTNLFDVYKNPSDKKRNAWEDIWLTCRKHAYGVPRIISHTCHKFTVATVKFENNRYSLLVWTATNDYIIPMFHPVTMMDDVLYYEDQMTGELVTYEWIKENVLIVRR